MEVTFLETDGSATATGRRMHEMVRRYHADMLPYAHLGVDEAFSLVKSVPFRFDPCEVETLQRPAYTMQGDGPGGDCDDKCIALACWAYNAGVPYRFVAVRRPDRDRLHHVICELYIGNQWVHADPTYPFNSLGRAREAYAEGVPI